MAEENETFKYQTYACPVHGNIEIMTLEIMVNGEGLGKRCMRCFDDALDRIGVSRVAPTGETIDLPYPPEDEGSSVAVGGRVN